MLAALGFLIIFVGWPAGTAVAGAALLTALVNLDGRRPRPDERADWAAFAARSEFLPVTFLASRPALALPLLALPALDLPLLDFALLDFPPLPKERADREEAFLILNF